MKKLPLVPVMRTFEDSIITLSGPALAISGIIAGVDLLTGGGMLKQVAWLSFVWAICLLLTLDFQVLSLGARSHRTYLSNKSTWRKVVEVATATLIAAGISSVSIQMQSIIARANGVGIGIEQATYQLGINPIALIWERSSLVLVLIFLSGWFRDENGKQTPAVAPVAVTPNIEEVVNSALAKATDSINTAYQQRFDTLIQQVESVRVTMIEQVTQIQYQLPTPRTETVASVVTETSQDDESVEARVKAVLAETPAVSIRKLAELAQCAPNTASRWKKRIQESEI